MERVGGGGGRALRGWNGTRVAAGQRSAQILLGCTSSGRRRRSGSAAALLEERRPPPGAPGLTAAAATRERRRPAAGQSPWRRPGTSAAAGRGAGSGGWCYWLSVLARRGGPRRGPGAEPFAREAACAAHLHAITICVCIITARRSHSCFLRRGRGSGYRPPPCRGHASADRPAVRTFTPDRPPGEVVTPGINSLAGGQSGACCRSLR